MAKKLKWYFLLVLIGLLLLFAAFYVPVPLSIVSLETPVATVTVEGISPTQAILTFIAVVLILVGAIVYLIEKKYIKV